MEKYPHIFQPLTINGMTLRNRIVMPPMGSNFANFDGTINNDHIKYYEQRAKGGTALITLENVCVDYPLGTNGTTQLRMDNDQFMPGLWKFNERMHAFGACTSVQINHAGASATKLRLNGLQPVSSSTVPSKKGMLHPRPLTVEEIQHIINCYADAAKRAQRVGFDCVEIHAGHGYLIDQFLSPHYNHRYDAYGGSPANRARFAKEVILAVRGAVGSGFPISLRFSADELVQDGNSLQDTLSLLEYFIEPVDILNVSAAVNETIQYQIDKMSLPDGWRSYMAKAVKSKFDKVIVTSGNFRSPKVTEDVLSRGDADLIAMGRGLLAEPNWVNKVALGQEKLLRKCISCNIGCADHRIAKGLPIRCTVNPDVINEDEYRRHRVRNNILMVVIGGGTTALEAACSAAEIGANVVLFERLDYLGGLAHQIARLPGKHRLDDFVSYLKNRADLLDNLTIHLGETATINTIKALKPDVIVNASGSQPLLPPIDGLEKAVHEKSSTVFTILDLLNSPKSFVEKNQEIVVVGGGAVGLDVMEFFADYCDCHVSVIEMLPELGKDLDLITKVSMDEILKKKSVTQYTNTKVKSVADHHCQVIAGDKRFEIGFDKAFICLGMRSYQPLLKQFENYAYENGTKVLNIGDSKKARRIYEGSQEARQVINIVHQIDEIKDNSLISI
ncbi:FAD-dependent oxidoreductase [Loigolactobacillus coryniformis]|uniref:oxidoreductase n=1 Tax=Loigolactobacillus coryniformis TaxID=1610 RepID=UPI00345E0376